MRLSIAMITLSLGMMASTANSQEAPNSRLSVRAPGATNLFSGKLAKLNCQVTSQDAGDATVAWSFSVERGVVARGEKVLQLAANRPAEFGIEVDVPALRPGLAASAALTLDIRSRTGARSQKAVSLYVFSPDVAANRERWLKSLDITLFDPAKTTSSVLESSQIPHRLSDGPKGVDGRGVLIHGAGIEGGRIANSWQSALAAAASGRRVIVLASSGAMVPIDGLFVASDEGPASVSLRRSDVIREFDKRLDATEWTHPGKLVASSLHWTVRDGSPRLDLKDDAAGWPWLDLRYPGGGRLVWIGFGVTESWDSTPAARYLLVKVLEDLTNETPVTGGQKHAAQ